MRGAEHSKQLQGLLKSRLVIFGITFDKNNLTTSLRVECKGLADVRLRKAAKCSIQYIDKARAGVFQYAVAVQL